MKWDPTLDASGVATTLGVLVAAYGIYRASKLSFKSWQAADSAATANKDMVIEARQLRREQSQPYVVVYMYQLPHKRYVVDLAIKNIGATAARDIKVEITPQPRRGCGSPDSGGMPVDVWLPKKIPLLVPGQEWRTRWDIARFRVNKDKSEFPDEHTATVTYTDSERNGPDGNPGAYNYEFVLDWGIYWGTIGMDDE